jgi:hypothetical protein
VVRVMAQARTPLTAEQILLSLLSTHALRVAHNGSCTVFPVVLRRKCPLCSVECYVGLVLSDLRHVNRTLNIHSRKSRSKGNIGPVTNDLTTFFGPSPIGRDDIPLGRGAGKRG